MGLLHSSLYTLAMTMELRNWRSESELRVFSQRVLSLRQYHEESREDPVNVCWSVFSFFSILCLFSPSTCSLLLLPLPLAPCSVLWQVALDWLKNRKLLQNPQCYKGKERSCVYRCDCNWVIKDLRQA